MKSIDELRNHIKLMRDQGLTMVSMTTVNTHLNKIEHELEEGYVELPKDADGEHIHIGDKLVGKYLEGNPVVECTRLTFANDWTVGHGRGAGTPNLYVRHKSPTVEDVLREFVFDACGDSTPEEAVVKRFAERLRLREED